MCDANLPINLIGGTTICRLAQVNDMVSDYSNNCLWTRPDDAAETQIREFSASNWTFMAVEYTHLPFQDDDLPLPGDVVYITTLRHPLERSLSAFRCQPAHEKGNHTFVQFSINAIREYEEMEEAKDKKKDIDSFSKDGKQVRNFYHYMLGACSNERHEEGLCMQPSLAKAKRRLEYFSVVMITDDSATFISTARMLGTRLGWRDINVNTSLLL